MTTPGQQILTVNLEDYFQVGAFNQFIQLNRWQHFESRVAQSAMLTLDLLAKHKAKATFFVLGYTAEKDPEILRAIVEQGHEIGVRGYYHRKVGDMTPEEFKADVTRARQVIEQATGQRVHGYRFADGWMGPSDLWALDALAELGFTYDSSLCPMRNSFGDDPRRLTPHQHTAGSRSILEVPISTGKIAGVRVPVAGGNYLRQLPQWLTRSASNRWVQHHVTPLVAYFQSWELDANQPQITGVSAFARLRHYRNLKAMPGRLAELLQRFRFGSIADYLQIAPEPLTQWTPAPAPAFSGTHAVDVQLMSSTGPRTPISIVIPCFNEELLIPHLKNTLEVVRAKMGRSYEIEFLIVDDGSSDGTWNQLQAAFGGHPSYHVLRHSTNLGISAAIMTGIRAAHNDTVCSMDSDGSYDPLKLAEMIPLLATGVDLVTASPYHPAGGVKNVPGWRLWLSKGCAWLYRRLMKTKLHTYTSCFRVYRRSTVAAIPMTYNRYLGIAELVGRLDLAQKQIVEYPAVLESRMIGRSKMKVVSTVLGHVRLLLRLSFDRWRQEKGTDRDHVIRSQLGYLNQHVVPDMKALPASSPPNTTTPLGRMVRSNPVPQSVPTKSTSPR